MAERSGATACLALLYLACLAAQAVRANPVNIPLTQVPSRLLEKAWRALNDHSPTHHLYAHGNLINAQELEEPPYKVYKFTYDLSPICGTESCPREACTIDLKQDEHGDVETLNDSIQCMYFYPADAQNDMSQEQQSYQEQEDSQVTQESLAEQVNSNRSVELDHEIQETGDENVRPFIAMRASGYCPGCPYELNPNLPGLLAFGEQALRSMDERTAGDYKHKLMSIVRVTRSVPVSSNVIQYQLLLQIGESECLKNALEQEQECLLRTTVPTKLCLVTFEQRPWQQSSLRITKNNCTDPENASSANGQPQRSSSLESESLVTVKYDEAKPAGTEMADVYESLKEMLDNYTHVPSTPSKEPEEAEVTESAVKVVLNKSQDDEKVLGFTDKAKEYREFLEDFDLPVKVEDVTVDTTGGAMKEVKEEKFLRKKVEDFKASDKETVNNRRKRSKRLVGAPSPIPVDNAEIQVYADKALHKLSAQSNDPNEPAIVEIVEASVQVVQGKLYKIKARVGVSDCPKGTNNNCQVLAGGEVKECIINVWSRPWLDQGSPEITVDCSPSQSKRRKRSLRGTNYSKNMLQIAEDMRVERLFDKFAETYNRTYSTPEERNLRLRIFRENLGIIDLLQQNEEGTGRYGVNMFADVSREEFRERYLGLRPDLRSENEIPLREAEIPDIDLPPTFDWRKKGVVTPVKNQGSCGSCWAFSVTGNVEGQYAIQHGQLLSLSEQELVDCDDLDDGCSGGLPDNAYRAIEKLGGLELESDYPYEAENEKCHFKKNLAKVQLASAVNITSDEVQMAQWLVQNGPISIGINANAMQFYIGGVSHPFKFLCNPKNLDHGVLIVGYGTSSYPLFHKKLPYWIIKNSWGKSWGEQGYYRVYRGDGTCGVNTMASSAVVV
ncbi:PREDICTED: putative cysteine proteinase CG12163 [Vollenhovia emeryi]|uniref:putative cysteine proteinase CG12163 n=1 Tax=Vollenhovia emeryi TaxID=411798 RepID=UPI0005F5399E|nr:PREDICTED: putative cysteine proteinase CG12163 [Vollenhovia emeryi]